MKLLVAQGVAMNQEVTFMSDGGRSVRDLLLYMRPNAERVLDYFHVAMPVTVLQQLARGLPPPLSEAVPAMIEALESIRRFIWHGNVGRALGLVDDLGDAVDFLHHPPAQVRKFRRHLDEFSGYITNNARLIPNYAERRRYGEAVSTAFVESTVNQVIAKRFAKKQQMQVDAARRPPAHPVAHPRTRWHTQWRLPALAKTAPSVVRWNGRGRMTPPAF